MQDKTSRKICAKKPHQTTEQAINIEAEGMTPYLNLANCNRHI